MSIKIGDMIDTYQVTEKLGSGGMAAVYKAYQERLDRYVAIKVMHPSVAEQGDFLARFKREARIVASLDHPYIVPIYDYNEMDGQPYLVMKHIAGRTLKDVMADERLSSGRTLEIITKMAEALDYAHEEGVLHRDVKPSNILIDTRGIPYLTDFGLARVARAGESTMSADVMLGTPQYISPEQARGASDIDARTDVYSLGVVLYEMVTGRTPFTGDSSLSIIHDQIYTAPPPAREVAPDVPEAVEAVLERALAKDVNARYQTPSALVAAYRQSMQGEVVEPVNRFKSKPAYADPPPPPPAQHDDSRPKPFTDRDKQPFGFGFDGSVNMDRTNWQVGTRWQTGPDGRKGFYSDQEIRKYEATLSEEERLRHRVEKRLEERNEVLVHLAIYLAVNLMLWIIYFSSDPGGHPWPIWPTMGWGIGMGAHILGYYFQHGPGRHYRESQIEREVARERERMADTSKPKRKTGDMRLTEDGELSESFAASYDEQHYEDGAGGNPG